jgi:hypothetical protein
VPSTVFIPAATAVVAALFALALIDQWRERRQPFQFIWAIGMSLFAIAAGCEAVAGAAGWNDVLYRIWYGSAIMTPGWLGLGTVYLLARTRFGYTVAVCLALAGMFTLLTQRRYDYAGAGIAPVLYLIAALILAVAVAFETYFGSDRWPRLVALGVASASLLAVILLATTTIAAPGYALDSRTGAPTGDLLPGSIRLLAPFLNITGAFALVLGAVFSTYVFMPKRRVLGYSLDPAQPGDEFLFNIFIAPVAIVVNLIASLPGMARALVAGRIQSRVPSTILIAIGAFIPIVTDTLNRFGSTQFYELGKLVSVVLLFAGFLVSVEVFREIRVPFTSIRLVGGRVEGPRAPDSPEPPGTRPRSTG